MGYALYETNTSEIDDMDWEDNNCRVYSFDTRKEIGKDNGGSNRNNKYRKLKATHPIKSLEDIQKIKNYFDGLEVDRYKTKFRNKLLFVLGINIGLRCNDLVNLKWDKVFDKDREFYDGMTVLEGKTGKLRDIVYTDNLKNIFNEYLNNMEIDRQDIDLDSYIFATRQSPHITVDAVSKMLKTTLKEVGLTGSNWSSHLLRKTYAYWLYQNSEYDIALVMKMLNHSSQAITLRYIDVVSEDVIKASQLVNL
mgnify:CR=1 FL=1